ncbi:DUF6197 family protein [Blastococcus sp. SYSU D00813]
MQVTASPPTTAPGVLYAAADYLEQPGHWGKGFYAQGDGACRCALGAIAAVVDPASVDVDPAFVHHPLDPRRHLANDAVWLLEAYLALQVGYVQPEDSGPFVGAWNDEQESADVVVQTMRDAAAWGSHL